MSSDRLTEVYKFFSTANGNQHIASEFAVLKLQQLIHRFKIKSVLEVGLGIGAVAGSLLAVNKVIKYSGTENNQFCLDSLKSNLNGSYEKLEIFSELSKIPPRKFDLIIIDGKDSGLSKIQQWINTRSIIVIEGDRLPQQELLVKYFPRHMYVHSISSKKNKNYSPFSSSHWQGGLKIYLLIQIFFRSCGGLKKKFVLNLRILSEVA